MAWPPATHDDVEDRIDSITFPSYWRSGHYSHGHFTASPLGTTPTGSATVIARPFLVLSPVTVDRIGIHVTTGSTAASGGLIQCAIYNPGPLPGALLLETSTVSNETTGAKEWVINETLTPGVWWVAVRSVIATCTITAWNSSDLASPFVHGYTVPLSVQTFLGAYNYTVTSGTAGFTADGSSPAGTQTSSPLVSLRAA